MKSVGSFRIYRWGSETGVGVEYDSRVFHMYYRISFVEFIRYEEYMGKHKLYSSLLTGKEFYNLEHWIDPI